MTIRFLHDTDGSPRAETADPAEAAFARFLTEEAHWPHYAAHLGAATTGDTATGNAYAVSVDATQVTITHLHLPQAPLLVPRGRFTEVMRDWARFLGANP